MNTGILQDVLKIMQVAALKFSKLETVTVLAFDEMKVCEDIEYDQSSDKVISIHLNFLKLFLRCLYTLFIFH